MKLQFDVRVNNTSALRFTHTKPREHVAVAMTAARFDAALTEDKMASALQRRELAELGHILYADTDSSASDSSDDEDMDILFVDAAFPPSVSNGERVCLEEMSDFQCERLFRFDKSALHRLVAGLSLPEYYRCTQGTKATGMEALLILLRRLSYPNRWYDLVSLFGRAEPELSMIFNQIVDDVYDRFSCRLSSLDLVWLNVAAFSDAIHAKGAALDNCWGFIDGTVRPIARPSRNQSIMYSGHKRVHCIKFQSLVTPNGLIAHLFGPMEGKRHDAFMLSISGLTPKISRFNQPSGAPYVVYGDPAYGLMRNIMAPYRGAQLTAQQQQFNKSMSAVRISVEWTFGKICQYFTYVDLKRNNKVLLQPIGKYYAVAALLTNCHTCMYGSMTSKFFNVDPPSLESYLFNL